MTKLAYFAPCLGFALLLGCSEDSTSAEGGGGDPPDPDATCPEDGDNAGPPIAATFAPPIFIPIDVEPAHLVSGDFNDDGHVDIAVAEGLKSDAVVVFPGDGTGALGAAQAVAGSPNGGFDCAVGDVDADGVDDLVVGRFVVGTNTALVTVHFGGAAFPGDMVEIAGAPGLVQAREVAVGDFDGDGALDIAAFTGVDVAIAFNAGGRTFSSAIGQGVGEAQYGLAGVDAANLDADAAIEILGVTGTGSWRRYDVAPGRTVQASSVGDAAAGVAARPPADLDGDGRAELIRAEDNGLRIFWNDGSFADPALFCVSTSLAYGAAGAAAADFDGDGRADLVASTGDRQLAVLGGDGSRGFREPRMLAADAPGEVIATDLNGDGEPDIIVAAAPPGGGGQLEVHLRTSN